ncbi:hypothetical protein ABT186_34865 [Streptomyces sp. NPDC001634]|uniref:hypothetical protein n=1 Tax=Streptomyces sp. NPDC001634 TaxID=3154390 RepID=UPI003316E4AE
MPSRAAGIAGTKKGSKRFFIVAAWAGDSFGTTSLFQMVLDSCLSGGSGVLPYGTFALTAAGSHSMQNVSQASRPALYSCSSLPGAVGAEDEEQRPGVVLRGPQGAEVTPGVGPPAGADVGPAGVGFGSEEASMTVHPAASTAPAAPASPDRVRRRLGPDA